MASQLQAALPKRHYVDPAAYAEEHDRVLLRAWSCVGRLDELGLAEAGTGRLIPNRGAAVGVLGESILVAVTADGGLRAHYNVCRHRGAQLVVHEPAAAPICRPVHVWRCPYHSWTYDLDGRLVHAPHTGGLGVEPAAFALHPVGAGAWGGFLWLRLDPSLGETLDDAVAPARQRLGRYPLETLRVGYRARYDVRANWKVIAENYNECYHCGPVHPELTRLVPAFAGGAADLDWERGIEHRAGAWTFTITGKSSRAPFPALDADERVRHKGELVYPTLLLSAAAEHVAAFRLEPLAADRTRINCELLFAPDELQRPGFDPSDAAELWEIVNAQDWAVCESVQRGMSSRAYVDGWYAPMEDASLDIRRWLLPRLEDTANA